MSFPSPRLPAAAGLATLALAVSGLPGLSTTASAAASTSLEVVAVDVPISHDPRDVDVLGTTSNGTTWVREYRDGYPVGSYAYDASGAQTGVMHHPFSYAELIGDAWFATEYDAVRWTEATPVRDPDLETRDTTWQILKVGERRAVSAGVPGHAVVHEGHPVEPSGEPVVLSLVDGTVHETALPRVLPGSFEWSYTLDQRHVLVERSDGHEFVDLVNDRVWAVSPSSPCTDPDRRFTSTRIATVDGRTRAAWLNQTSDGNATLCATDLDPDTAGTALSPTATSVGDLDLAPDTYTSHTEALPVADGVLITRSSAADGSHDLHLVSHDGTVRTVVEDATLVTPFSDSGRVVSTVLLRDGTPNAARVRVADGHVEWLGPRWPKDAEVAGVHVDGTRLLVHDDRSPGAAMTEYSVTPRTGSTAGSSREVGTVTTSPRGDVALSRDDAGRDVLIAGVSSTRQNPQPHVMRSGAESSGLPRALSRFHATDGRWALSGGNLIDLASGNRIDDTTLWWEGLHRGTAWRTDRRGNTGLAPRIAFLDVATGRATSSFVPGCATQLEAQMAGRFVLATCLTADRTSIAALRDLRSSTWTPVPVHGSALLLGNGFVVGAGTRGDAPAGLWWLPLNDLRSAPRPVPGAPASIPTYRVSVTTEPGSTPSFAWQDVSTSNVSPVRVAFPDVTPTAAHRFTSGVTTPSPVTGLAAEAGSRAAVVSWTAPPAAHQVDTYTITAYAGNRTVGTHAVDVAPGRTGRVSTTMTLRVTGRSPETAPVRFEVTAHNAAGASTVTSSEDVERRLSPGTPTDPELVKDRLGRTTVSWTWQPRAAVETPHAVQPLKGFRVLANGIAVHQGLLSPDSRSHRFPPSFGAEQAQITVEAVGEIDRVPVSLEATITPAPAVNDDQGGNITTPAVVVGRTVTAQVFHDRESLAHTFDVQVRRTAAVGRRGSWVSPAHLQHLPVAAGIRTIRATAHKAGTQVCFRVRARDELGHVTRWSEPRCSVRMVDDRALKLSPGLKRSAAKRLRSPSHLASTATRMTTTGRGGHRTTLEGPRTQGTHGWLVATTCPTCGKVRVEVARRGSFTFSEIIDLRSAKRRHRVLIPISPLGTVRPGTLRVVRISGKPVIDGVALHR